MEFTNANALNPEDPMPDLLISRTYATIGEYAKAMQYAETAVGQQPCRCQLARQSWRDVYIAMHIWNEAIIELGYVVNGGVTQDGDRSKRITLVPNNARIAEYYFTYGLALSRLNKCGEALQVAQYHPRAYSCR